MQVCACLRVCANGVGKLKSPNCDFTEWINLITNPTSKQTVGSGQARSRWTHIWIPMPMTPPAVPAVQKALPRKRRPWLLRLRNYQSSNPTVNGKGISGPATSVHGKKLCHSTSFDCCSSCPNSGRSVYGQLFPWFGISYSAWMDQWYSWQPDLASRFLRCVSVRGTGVNWAAVMHMCTDFCCRLLISQTLWVRFCCFLELRPDICHQISSIMSIEFHIKDIF